MADIREWLKGIGIFIVTTLMFYFLWTQIFMNILGWVAINPTTGVGDSSTSILTVLAWVSFILLYAFCSPIYLVYTFIVGARDDVKTSPLELLKAIGIWGLCVPLMTIAYLLASSIITAGESVGIMDAGATTMANTMSWIIALICIIVIDAVPMIYVLRGYGFLEAGGEKKDEE